MATRHGVDLKITRLLLQIGLMCGELGRGEEGLRIVNSVRDFRDDLPQPGTVLALIYLRQGRLEEAEAELDAVLSQYPDHQLAKALLGMVYREAGRADWQNILHEVIEDGREEWSIRLARSLLGEDAPEQSISSDAEDERDRAAFTQRIYA